MQLTTIGIDLAKNVFQVHAVDASGAKVFNKSVKRANLADFIARQQPCLIGMEACSGAHHWARKFQRFGHTVRLMAPQFVKPYVKSNKNDAADAEAICEAVARPNMRFVPLKNTEQQAILALHRIRLGLVQARTAQANQIRGLMAEFGVVVPQGRHHLQTEVPALLEDADNELPGVLRITMTEELERMHELDARVQALDKRIEQWHRKSEQSSKIADIPGIGPLTASALIASIGDATNFDNGRQLSAWLGLVPRQHSSGGKQNLLGISKRGDKYLRMLLIHGARAVLQQVQKRVTAGLAPEGQWLSSLAERRSQNKAVVALANKNARTVWALLAHGRKYDPVWAQERQMKTAPSL